MAFVGLLKRVFDNESLVGNFNEKNLNCILYAMKYRNNCSRNILEDFMHNLYFYALRSSKNLYNPKNNQNLMGKIIQIEVPQELTERDVKIAIAVELYREGKLTLKQASELAGLCLEDFMKILSEKKVSVINWDEEELKTELKNADSF